MSGERVSKDAYERCIENRPFKFAPNEVNYHEYDDKDQRCETCVHFFNRVKDDWKTCEILRIVKKKDEEPIDPEYVCSFWTEDGQEFPLLESDK